MICVAAGHPHHRLTLVCGLLVWAAAAWLRTWQVTSLPAHHVARFLGEEPSVVRVQGVVIGDPVESFTPYERAQQVCVLRVSALNRSAHWQPATGLIRLRVEEPRFLLSYGDAIIAEGRAALPRPPGNPGQYDWRAALSRQQIHAVMTVRPHHGLARLGRRREHAWLRAIYTVRHRLEQAITRAFHEPHAGLMRALVLGQRVAIDESTKRAFVTTGTMHLLVVSGFNVGLIAGLLELLLRLLGLPRRARLLASGLGVGVYCLLTGMQPPVLRATLMAWAVIGAWWLDRAIQWPNILAAAAIAILLVNPLQLWDAGFQLSFGAVASLLLFPKPIVTRLDGALAALPARLRRYASTGLGATVAVWIGLWPLLAWYFQVVSPVSMLANLLVVPLVSVVVIAGTIAVGVGSIWQAGLDAGAGVFHALLDAMLGLVRMCEQMPGGWWLVARPAWWVIAGYYLLVALTVLRPRLRWSPARVMIGWGIGLAVWMWAGAWGRWSESRWTQIAVLDVGHGDAIVVRTPERHTLLVDAASAEAGRYVVVPFLRTRGWTTIDALILTHPDEDHLGGVPAIVETLRVRRAFTNGYSPDTPTAQRVWAALTRRRIPHTVLRAGMQLTASPRLEMIVLHPPADGTPAAELSSNENSLVMSVRAGAFGMLLAGDLEEGGIPSLLRWGERLRATVLKVPHHGSALGERGVPLWEAVAPQLAILSAGRRRGLPSPQTLRELTEAGAHVMKTHDAGAVIVRTDGSQMRVETFREKKNRFVFLR